MNFPKSLPIALALIALALPTIAAEDTVVLFPPDLALAKEGKISIFAFSPSGSAVPVAVDGEAKEPLGGDRLKAGKVDLRPGMNTVDVGGVRIRVYSKPGAGMDREYVYPDIDVPPLVFQAYRVHPAMDDGCDGCHSLEGGKVTARNQKEACYACHENFEKGTAGKYIHAPVAAGECTGCHDPHFSARAKLQKLEKGCLECHDPEPAEESVHYPVREGRCMSCHGPHAGASPKQMVRSGNALCLECHASPHSHHPFGPVGKLQVTTSVPPDIPRNSDQFSCLACHLPHRSSERRLFRKSQGDLCKTCHPV